MTTLTPEEIKLGWVEFHCDVHGFLAATTSNADVFCACGKRARRLRYGRLVDQDTLKSTRAKARKFNKAGFPFIHECSVCGGDFGGREIWKRHRVGRKTSEKRCLTTEEMLVKGWKLDDSGRWRRPPPTSTDLQTPHKVEG